MRTVAMTHVFPMIISHSAFMMICQLNVTFDHIPMLACRTDTAPHPAWFFRVSMEANVISVHPTMTPKFLPESELLKPAIHS